MYPLSAVLVGSDETVLPHVRRELLNADVRVAAEFPDADHAVEAVRPASGERHLFVLHLPAAGHLPGLRRLSGTFVGQPALALVGHDDPNLLIGAMRGGAAQVVPLPLQAEDFKSALDVPYT
jgi:DNA-binding NarL/FixJ family response regulator